MSDNDGVIDKVVMRFDGERVELKLNYYGLARALIAAGLVAEGFAVEYAVSLRKETPV